jgi:hypothetical protein
VTVISKSVMEEGKAAKLAGQADSSNPYPAGSQNSADWLEGYTFDEPEQNTNRAESDD